MVAELEQPLAQCVDAASYLRNKRCREIADSRKFFRLLRLSRKTKCKEHGTKNDAKHLHCLAIADCLLPKAYVHRITLSARASTFGGMIRPICFAALRLIISSNFF